VLTDGAVTSGSVELGYFGGKGEMQQSGGTVVTGDLYVKPLCRYEFTGGSLSVTDKFYFAGLLVVGIGAGGISPIEADSLSSLDGTLTIRDDGAPFGRFAILVSQQPFGGAPATVNFPGPDWSWGVDGGSTLWVEHVPEPSTLLLLSTGVVGLLADAWRKRRRR
jgi:hypothetical protein